MADWFDGLPKIELHLHLEGAIPLPVLLELVRKYEPGGTVRTLDQMKKRFIYRDFSEFIRTWVWKNQFLREYDDFELIAEETARELHRQNVFYAEVFFSPADFSRHGLETRRLTEAIRLGFSRVPEIKIFLIADLVRDYGPEKAMKTLTEIHEVRDCGVIGIGLGGSEKEYPPELFADVFDRARLLGFHTTAHAGEAAGAGSVRSAIEVLHVERIGHGTRAHEDIQLLDLLAARKIPLEMCPISNVRTGVVGSIEEHPIFDYFHRGIVVTVNTDDPGMFGNTLAVEYRLLHEKLGLSKSDILTMITNAITGSWLTEEEKRIYRSRLPAGANDG
jgi:adenosine deaminase